MANEGIAEIFLEIADLLDLEGVKFKPEAYRRAARTLQQLPTDVKDLVRTGKVDEVPGIGEALSEKVREYVATGSVPYLEKLRQQWPPGLLELMRLEGIGPKTTRRFFVEFQVTGPEDLEKLIRDGKLRGVFGFGDRKIELFQRALARARTSPSPRSGERRIPLPMAQAAADDLLASLRGSGAPFEQLLFAGSLRRRRETVGDLDLLATSSRPKEVMDRFVHLEEVGEVRLSGETKSTVVLKEGLQVDLRVVAPEAFGAALQYFTGSKDHNVHLRSLANKKGLSINEYGLTRDEKLVPARTEEEVYAAVGLPWIPPELREDQGEIEAAARGEVPPIASDRDLTGEYHIHVPPSMGVEDVAPWVEALRSLGLRYGGFVVREQDLQAKRTTLDDLRAALPKRPSDVRLLLAVEVLLDPQGWPPIPEGTDFVVVRPPTHRISSPREWWQALVGNPPSTPAVLGHVDPETLASSGLEWKDLLSEPSPFAAVEVAVTHEKVAVETAKVHELALSGLQVALSGLPRQPEELPRLLLAAGVARRGWTPRAQVMNSRDPSFGIVPVGSPSPDSTRPKERPKGPSARPARRGG
ncbi:MAG: hypothetical protein KGJ69_01735 [Thermoplasmata archaeon]|nr:hypothetical protein [Thermoplasmata archaeon]